MSVFRQVKDEGKQIKIMVKPGEWKDASATVSMPDSGTDGDGSSADLGLTVEALTRERATQMGLKTAEGVVVTKIEPTSLAAAPSGNERGINRGDVITAINHQPIGNPKQFHDAMKNVDTKKGVILNLASKDTTWFEILKEPADN